MNTSLITAIQGESHVRIDLDRYGANVRRLKASVGPETAFMAVLKADAYGHGAIECGKVALESGATHLAVARIWEGMRLRHAGITAPVLVLGGPNLHTLDLATANDLTLTVGSESAAAAVEVAAQMAGHPLRVHLKLDTGLHRYGLYLDAAREIASRFQLNPSIDLEGVYAHFSSADERDPAPTQDQISRAHAMLDTLEADGIRFRYIHLPNSAATITGMSGRSNLCRSGIASYGLSPSGDVTLPEGIAPVMSVHSRITRAFELPTGEGVSYGLTYRSAGDERSATVPIGYADGLPRSLSSKGWFVIAGERCPIRGRVCMDQTVVGLTSDVAENDAVSVVGDGSDGAMTIDDIAAIDGTINYEIATRFSARMPRLYIRNGAPVGYDFPGGPIDGHK